MNQDPDRSKGWIQLHRRLLENPLWTERREFSRAEAWLDILLNVQHSEEQSKILSGNCVVECGRGQSIKSLETWGSRWNWNKSKVRRFFKLLEDLSMIRHESVTKTTRITACNYDTYNPPRNASETQVKRKRNAVETQVTPDKNVRMEECKNTPHKPPRGGKYATPQIPQCLAEVDGFDAEFAEYLMARKTKATTRAQELVLATLAERPTQAVTALQIAIVRGWAGIKWEWVDNHVRTAPRGMTPGQVHREDTPCPL